MRKIIFLFSLFFIACSTHQVSVYKPKPLPQWYLNPPKNSQNYVYVTGSGIDKKEAVLNALNNFIAQYSVKITSSFEINKSSYGGYLSSSTAKQKIQAKIHALEISNYEIIKTEPYKFDEILVLVKIDLNKLSKNLKSKLAERFKKYKEEFANISNMDPIRKIIYLKKLNQKLNDEVPTIFILKDMDPDFNDKPYLNFINNVYKKYQMAINNTYITLKSDNPVIKEEIKKYLTSKNIKIGKSPLVLEIKTSKKYSKSLVPVDVYNVYLDLKYKGNIIGNNHFKIVVAHNGDIQGVLFNEIQNKSLEEFFNL